jgi:long-subunit acyl-CoA synthetase (AMP-forming)
VTKQKYEDLISELKIACHELKKNLQITQHKLVSAELERDHLKAIFASTKQNFELENISLQDKCRKLNNALEDQKLIISENDEKLRIYAQNQMEWERLRMQVRLFVHASRYLSFVFLFFYLGCLS